MVLVVADVTSVASATTALAFPSVGVAVTVGAGKTMIIDVLQIGDL